ncbi:putative cytochrome P450 [Rosellinia necatrix]|uniref:Putative cytochrome P450 n=1 Tax=Rosellinia necatrix TaxID=77044 RepID=A0A1W2TAJ8_ROSNE|nr:putative cytochrome P450 [Rosellinia necatrix]
MADANFWNISSLLMADYVVAFSPNATSIKDHGRGLLPAHAPTETYAALACTLLLLPAVVYSITFWRFSLTSARPDGDLKLLVNPPVIPYWDVLFGHFFNLAWDTKGFLTKAVQLASRGPAECKATIVNFTVVSDPAQIRKIFRACGHFSNKQMAVVALQNLFGASKKVAELFESHDVDVAKIGAIGTDGNSNARGEARLRDHVSSFGAYAHTYLSSPYLESLSKRYLANMERNVQSLHVQDEWAEFPDMYAFLQDLVSSATIEALMGSKVFEINPSIVDDFWTFERATPYFLRCFPRWLIPGRYKARERIFDTMKKLDRLACQNLPRFTPEAPDWEPYLGSKFMRARHEYGQSIRPLPEDTKAWEKMGIMFAANANLLPIMFWYLFEALKSHDLQQRMIEEIRTCVSPGAPGAPDVGLDIGSLLEKPLMQSAYAETLRLRVAIALPRICEHSDFDLMGYRIKKNQLLVVLTWPVLKDEAAWRQSGRPPWKKGLDEFWADRFLVPKQATKGEGHVAGDPPEYEYSLRGMSGRFLSYGGGQHLCPGRHYAKHQLIGTVAFLLSQYELELSHPAKSHEVQPDMRWFPSGSLPPNKKVSFRIRRKAKTTQS